MRLVAEFSVTTPAAGTVLTDPDTLGGVYLLSAYTAPAAGGSSIESLHQCSVVPAPGDDIVRLAPGVFYFDTDNNQYTDLTWYGYTFIATILGRVAGVRTKLRLFFMQKSILPVTPPVGAHLYRVIGIQHHPGRQKKEVFLEKIEAPVRP